MSHPTNTETMNKDPQNRTKNMYFPLFSSLWQLQVLATLEAIATSIPSLRDEETLMAWS